MASDSTESVSTISADSSLGNAWSPPESSSSRVGIGLLPVDRLPTGLDQDATARPEHVLGDGRLDSRPFVDGFGVEDSQEATRDELVDLLLVLRERIRLRLGLRRDDRVVVGDLLVVHDPPEGELFESEHVPRGRRVCRTLSDELALSA